MTQDGSYRMSRHSPSQSDFTSEYRSIAIEMAARFAGWTFPYDGVLRHNWGASPALLDGVNLLLGDFSGIRRFNIRHLR